MRSCAGAAQSVTNAAKETELKKSYLRPANRCAASTAHMMSARTDDTVKAQSAQYPAASASAGSAAYLRSGRNRNAAAPYRIPMCSPETANACAMPPVRDSSRKLASIPFALPVRSAYATPASSGGIFP